MSLGRRTAGHIPSRPAFGHNLPCPNTWKEKAGELPAREAAKDVEAGLQNKKVSGTKGKSRARGWLYLSLLAAVASQEALQAAETETLQGRRHKAPRETLRSAPAIGAQSGNQLRPGGWHTPKATLPNGVFIALSSAEKAREMEVCTKAKARTSGHLSHSWRLRHGRWEGDQTPV